MADNSENRKALLTSLAGAGKPSVGDKTANALRTTDVDLDNVDEEPDEESESETDEAGPDDSEESEGEQADESEEDEPVETDEDQGDDETETPEEEPQVEEQPEEAEETPDQRDEQITKLTNTVAQLQALVLQQVQRPQQQTPQPSPPPSDVPADVPDHVLQSALFGADEATVSRIPVDQWAKATSWVKKHADKEVKFLRNPTARYVEQIRDLVLRDLFQATEPLFSDYHARQAKEAKVSIFDAVPDKTVQTRAKEIFQQSTAAGSQDWTVIKEGMQNAVARAQLERVQAAAKQQSDKKKVGKLQQERAGGGKLKGRGNPIRQANGGSKKVPSMRPTEGLDDYSKRLARFFQDNPGA